MIEPVHPGQGGLFHGLQAPPGTRFVDHFRFVQAVDGFSQGIVVSITNPSNRCVEPRLIQSLGVTNREVLAATITVMYDPSWLSPGLLAAM